MADVAMESEGKAAGGRVTCSCGGGYDWVGCDFFTQKQIAELITHYFGGNRTPKLGNSDFETTSKQGLSLGGVAQEQ